MTNIYVMSDTVGGRIPRGFTSARGYHYTWSEADALYWRDDVDDRYVEYDDVDWNKVQKIG